LKTAQSRRPHHKNLPLELLILMASLQSGSLEQAKIEQEVLEIPTDLVTFCTTLRDADYNTLGHSQASLT
jgi:hypothetical protein